MRVLKDQKTTTAKYGFVLSGFQVRDSQSGKLVERYYKYPYKNRHQSAQDIKSIFMRRTANGLEMNVEAVK